MTKHRKFIKKLLISIIILPFVIILFAPFRMSSGNTIICRWTGLQSLFTDTPFELTINKKMKAELNGIDGPYIIKNNIYYVSSENQIISSKLKDLDSIEVIINNNENNENDKFKFSKKTELTSEESVYPLPNKLIAISDIEGNFNAFSSFLKENKVIDSRFNWIFGDGHLVLIGDFVDRGQNVTQVLWLIYKLEQEAARKNGKVHFILGNHEIMNFQGRWKYNDRKYVKIATEISKNPNWDGAVKYMYSDSTELGKWLRTKNVIEKVGNYIFVHGGLSPEILKYDLNIHRINIKTKENWDKDLFNKPKKDTIANFLIGRESPFWYRGLVKDYKYYDKVIEAELNKVLDYYGTNKIVIGHSVVKDISKDFNGKVIRIDVKHGIEKNSGFTKGLLIENGKEYKIDDKGNKEILK